MTEDREQRTENRGPKKSKSRAALCGCLLNGRHGGRPYIKWKINYFKPKGDLLRLSFHT